MTTGRPIFQPREPSHAVAVDKSLKGLAPFDVRAPVIGRLGRPSGVAVAGDTKATNTEPAERCAHSASLFHRDMVVYSSRTSPDCIRYGPRGVVIPGQQAESSEHEPVITFLQSGWLPVNTVVLEGRH